MTEPARYPKELCWRPWRHNPHAYANAGTMFYCPGRTQGSGESPTHILSRLYVDPVWLSTTPGVWQHFYAMYDRERRDMIRLQAGVWPEDTAGQVRVRRFGAPDFVKLPTTDWTPIPGLLRAQVICRLDWEPGDFILRHPKAWQGNLSIDSLSLIHI